MPVTIQKCLALCAFRRHFRSRDFLHCCLRFPFHLFPFFLQVGFDLLDMCWHGKITLHHSIKEAFVCSALDLGRRQAIVQ